MVRHSRDEGESLFDLENLRVLNERSKVNIKTVLYMASDSQTFEALFFCKASLGICSRIGFLGSH